MRAIQGTFNRFGWWAQGTINATTGSADSALGVTERTFQTNKDLTNIVWYFVSQGISSLDMRFSLLTNNHTADIDIWTGSVTKNPGKDSSVDCELQRMGTLDVVAGQQKGVIVTDLFADTIVVSNDGTLQGIGAVGNGADQLAGIAFDVKGANLIVFHGYDTIDSACKIWLRGYH